MTNKTQPPTPEVLYKGSCDACRASKIKCDHTCPCSRCRSLGIPCIPSAKGRGRPKTNKEPPAVVQSETTTDPAPLTPCSTPSLNPAPIVFPIAPTGPISLDSDKTTCGRARSTIERPRKKKSKLDEAQAKEKTLQHGTPPRIHSYQDVDRGPAALLPDIFSIEMEEELTPPVPGSPVDQPPPQAVTLPSQQPPRFFAQMYCRSAIFLMMSEFRRLHKLYKLDPFKVYAFMNSRAMQAIRFGVPDDYSTMMMDLQASLMGLQHWDQVMSPHDRSYAQAFTMTAGEERTPLFIQAKATIESALQPWEGSNTIAHSYSITIRGEPITYCNNYYYNMFLQDSELVAFNRQKFYAPLLWAKAVCPQNHRAFFAMLVRASLSTPDVQAGDCSIVAECRKKDGTVFPAIIRIRAFFFSSVGTGYSISIHSMPQATDDDFSSAPFYGTAPPQPAVVMPHHHYPMAAASSGSTSTSGAARHHRTTAPFFWTPEPTT